MNLDLKLIGHTQADVIKALDEVRNELINGSKSGRTAGGLPGASKYQFELQGEPVKGYLVLFDSEDENEPGLVQKNMVTNFHEAYCDFYERENATLYGVHEDDSLTVIHYVP